MKKTTCQGVAMILEVKNGEDEIFTLAAAIVPTEDAENWTWFFQNCMLNEELREYLNHPKSVLYSDRDKGLSKAANQVVKKAWKRKCFRHMMDNIAKDKSVRRSYQARTGKRKGYYTFQSMINILWSLQAARTKEQFDTLLAVIRKLNPAAATYIEKCDPYLYTTYVLFGTEKRKAVRTYQMSTSNPAEAEMSRLKSLGLRFKTPVEFFDGIIKLWIKLYTQGIVAAEVHKERGNILTNFAFNYFQKQKDLSNLLQINSCNGQIIYLKEVQGKNGEIISKQQYSYANFSTKECSVGCWYQMHMICAHGIGAAKACNLLALEDMNEDFVKHCFGKEWLASTFISCYRKEDAIQMSTAPVVVADLLPMENKPSRGRPRTSRFKSTLEGGMGTSVRQKRNLKRLTRFQLDGMSESATSKVSDEQWEADSDITIQTDDDKFTYYDDDDEESIKSASTISSVTVASKRKPLRTKKRARVLPPPAPVIAPQPTVPVKVGRKRQKKNEVESSKSHPQESSSVLGKES